MKTQVAVYEIFHESNNNSSNFKKYYKPMVCARKYISTMLNSISKIVTQIIKAKSL